tara:strand:+ start:53 stop:175 length:123 start_codon:yes stop_codon:yes gene_type:complete
MRSRKKRFGPLPSLNIQEIISNIEKKRKANPIKNIRYISG